jgi:hypothetical protein
MGIFWRIRIYKGIVGGFWRWQIDNLGLSVNLYVAILFFNTAAAAEYVVPTTGL